RQALHPVLPLFHDATMQTRLNKRILQLIKGDSTRERGKRQLTTENLPLLVGFSFNSRSAWKDVYYAPVQRRFSENTGKLTVILPEHWVPATLSLPKGANGIRFTVAAIALDSENKTFDSYYEHSPILSAAGLIKIGR